MTAATLRQTAAPDAKVKSEIHICAIPSSVQLCLARYFLMQTTPNPATRSAEPYENRYYETSLREFRFFRQIFWLPVLAICAF
jgi:hypothetical protein